MLKQKRYTQKQENAKQKENEEYGVFLLPEPYNDIKKLIDKYEFPTENVAFDIGRTIRYTNGYKFDRGSKTIVSRTYTEEGKPEQPTEDQYLPVILGYVKDINGSFESFGTAKSTIQGYIDNKMDRLDDIKEYAEPYPVIKEWSVETIGYLQDAKAEVDTNINGAIEPYEKAMDNISSFSEVIDSQ